MDTSGETPIRSARYDCRMWGWIQGLAGRARRAEGLIAFTEYACRFIKWAGGLGGAGLMMGLLARVEWYWETFRWAGLFGAGLVTWFLITLGLFLNSWRRSQTSAGAIVPSPKESGEAPVVSAAPEPEGLSCFGHPRLFNVTRDPGPNHGGPTQFACIELPVLFPQGAAACTIGLVAVYAHRTSDGYVGQKRLAWRFCEKRPFLLGEEARVPLVFIAHDARHHGYYGDVVGGEPHIGVGTDHVLTIVVDADGASVDRKFAISVLSSQITSALAVGQIRGGNRFIFREAGEPVFDVAAVESATESLPPARAMGPFGGPFGM